MTYPNRRRILQVALAVAITILLVAPVSATWSIIGVDRETGEIGIACASSGRRCKCWW